MATLAAVSVREVTWLDDDRCRVGSVTFETRAYPAPPSESEQSWDSATFLIFKPRSLIERHAELVADVRPRRIVELGICEGGSTVFLAELAQPQRLVAIDLRAPTSPALKDYLADADPGKTVRVHDDVDQAARSRLRTICDEAFGREPLDLVFDDCSHLYEPTRDSFNELFPRLRPGGVYSIEDWRWAHASMDSPPLAAMGVWPDEVPLTQLLFEIVLAIPSVPGLIRDVRIDVRSIEIERGEAQVEAETFDISKCSHPRGRSLLGDPNAWRD